MGQMSARRSGLPLVGNGVSTIRTNPGYVIAGDNHLVESVVDGTTYSYAYDAEGNVIARVDVATGMRIEYTWDLRNRLARVELINGQGDMVRAMEFRYDALNRRIVKMIGPEPLPPPPGPPTNSLDPGNWPAEHYVYDGSDIALVFFDPDGDDGGLTPQLRSRLLHGPAVDQVLTDESFSIPGPGETTTGIDGLFWQLADHQGTIRDVLNSQSCEGTGHIKYTAFGRILSVSDASGQPISLSLIGSHRYLYTGREYDYSSEFAGGGHDSEIHLQYNRARYYDAAIGRWLSQSPTGVVGGDANLYRYVGNSSPNRTDPPASSTVSGWPMAANSPLCCHSPSRPSTAPGLPLVLPLPRPQKTDWWKSDEEFDHWTGFYGVENFNRLPVWIQAEIISGRWPKHWPEPDPDGARASWAEWEAQKARDEAYSSGLYDPTKRRPEPWSYWLSAGMNDIIGAFAPIAGVNPLKPGGSHGPMSQARPARPSNTKPASRPGGAPAAPMATRGGESAATKRGREAHAEKDYGPGFQKEQRLPSGKKPDAVNVEEGVVVELKPNNPAAIRKGQRQVEGYRRELEGLHDKPFTARVETYDP